MMRLTKIAAVAGLLMAGTAANALTYTFSAAPDQGWSAFSFSFNTPTFLAAGDPIPLVPFTISNGSFSYTMNTAASTTLATQGRCFLFGTGDQTFPNGANTQCSLGFPPAGAADLWFFDGGTVLPSALGTTTGLYVAVFSGDVPAGQDFNGSLVISDVPEPASWALLITGFGLTGATLRRRRIVATVTA